MNDDENEADDEDYDNDDDDDRYTIRLFCTYDRPLMFT